MRGRTVVLFAAAWFATVGSAQRCHAVRSVVSLDFDWRFTLGDPEGAEAVAFDDSGWRLLDVPHDWSIEGEYAANNPTGGRGGYLPTGVGWYRKTIDVPSGWQQKRVWVEFDGVYMNSTVWLNGKKVGGRPYGYMSFTCDLWGALRAGKNVLAVRVDNSKAPSSRWYTGCGIYGHVRIVATDYVHVPPSGVFVRTLTAKPGQAEVRFTTEIMNTTGLPAPVTLVSWYVDPGGKRTGLSRVSTEVPGGATRPIEFTSRMARPRLWSPEDPALYLFEGEVHHDGKLVDRVRQRFGIRTVEFDSERGFLLNGRFVKLKGMCEHHDGGPVGAAFPDKVLEWRLKILKEMGCNAIRTAHNPRTPVFYDLCDQMGIMVMDEIFDGWHKKAEHDYGRYFFDEWWQRDVEDWVKRDRTHPCVVIWSVGNETGHADKHDITGLIHKYDTTRPTTGGTVFDGVDVAGFNGPGGQPGRLEKYHRDHPDRPIVLTEVPHTLQTRGFYRVRTWWRDKKKPRHEIPAYGEKQIFFDGHPRYSSSYDNCGVRISARTCWKRTMTTPWICGEFRWTGFDYLGEASFSGGKWPARIWNFGIIDLAGFPKDHYYFCQSQWTREPMVHLLPHWTHPGMDGVTIPVVAYSNCDEVELFLNGKSLGRKKPEELLDFVWQVPYAPGELKAVGYRENGAVAEKVVSTTGNPLKVRLESDNSDLQPDRQDVSLVTFSVRDAEGRVVPWAQDRIDFRMLGPVRLLGYENGDPVDVTRHRAPYRKVFYGLGRGFYQATGDEGNIEVVGLGILGDRLFKESTSVAVDFGRASLRGEMPAIEMVVHYTTDGSAPTAASKPYTGPFTLDASTTVRAVLLRDGKPFLTTQAGFVKGEKPRVSDPRWEEGYDSTSAAKVERGKFKGPFDKQLVGRWQEGQRQFIFTEEGAMLRVDGKKQTRVAWWWYDYPNDVFENPEDTGSGQLRWGNSGHVSKLELTSQKADSLRIKTGGKTRTFKKAPSRGLNAGATIRDGAKGLRCVSRAPMMRTS